MKINYELMHDSLKDQSEVVFKTENVNNTDVYIVSYMISRPELWLVPYSIEARGITFNKTGDCICRPFEKFFNLNEKEWLQERHFREMLEDKTYYVEVLDKLDGSMVTPVLINSDLVKFKTKKTFFSNEAQIANTFLTTKFKNVLLQLFEDGITPIFELTSPNNRIIIDYGLTKPKLTLIALRKIDSGLYLDHSVIYNIAKALDCDFVERKIIPRNEIADYILNESKTAIGIEGFVIRFTNQFTNEQTMVKVKTKWYLERHRLLEVRERDIAEHVLNETLDDHIPMLIETGANMHLIYQIQSDIAKWVNTVHNFVKTKADYYKTKYDNNQKMIAMDILGCSETDDTKMYASLIFSSIKGKDVYNDVVKYYKRNHLCDHSLESIIGRV